jgi:hypothetical protein
MLPGLCPLRLAAVSHKFPTLLTSASGLCQGKIKVKVRLRPTASQPMSSIYLGPKTKFLLLSDSCRFVDAGRPLWGEDSSVIYNCCCSSPAQPLSGPDTVRHMTMFYSLIFKTPPTWRARSRVCIPQEQGGPVIPPGTDFPFRRLYDSQGYGGGIQTRHHAGVSQSVGRLNCCWSSPAQSFLTSVSSRSMTKIFILSYTCTSFKMGPSLRWRGGWSFYVDAMFVAP